MGKSGRRDLRKELFWRRLIRGHGGSGLSIRAWCAKHGVSDISFHWWRRELVRRDAEQKVSAVKKRTGPGNSSSALLPVVVAQNTHRNIPSLIEIVLDDGRSVRLAGAVDRDSLADVLEVLEHRSC